MVKFFQIVGGDNIKVNKSLIAVFAIFLVVFSACAVSASEDVNVLADNDEDEIDDAGENGDEDDDENDTEIEYGVYEPETTGPGPMDVEHSNIGYPLESGSDSDNQTGADSNASSASSASSVSNAMNKTAAGNPILVLLAAFAVLGTYSIRRK